MGRSVTPSNCPHCQQVIASPTSEGVTPSECPSCGEPLGTIVERRPPPAPASTLLESRPTPFQPERVRESKLSTRVEPTPDATIAEPQKSGASKPGPQVEGDRARRTGPGGTDPLIGAVLGGCRITEVLGRGAMGTVYKATQLSLDRTVALKVIRAELCTDDDLLMRFQREAKTVGRFSTPHVVQIHDVGLEQNVHFIVMEFVAGGSLLTHVNEQPGQRLPPNEAIRFMIQAAEGLLDAERLQIVHRDIKPENLLLDHAGRVKVADFGISRSLTMSVELTATQAVIGTPLYMSPEQCRADKVDHRSDMYALGATFCHLLSGKRPLHEASVQELLRKKTTVEFLSPRKLAQDGSIPESLSRVIERMTALDRVDRYPSFKDLIEDLHKVERGEVIEPFVRASARARLRRRLVRSAVALVILSGVAVGAWQGFVYWQQHAPSPVPSGTPPGLARYSAAQLEEERAVLRRRMKEESASLTREAVDVSLRKAQLAEDGSGSAAALALMAAVADAHRLVDYRVSVDDLHSPAIEPPFSDLDRYWGRLRGLRDNALKAPAGAELTAFVQGDQSNREAADARRAAEQLAAALARVESETAGSLDSADLRREASKDIEAVIAGRTTLARLFPGSAAAISKAAPPERTEPIRTRLKEYVAPAAPADASLSIAEGERLLGNFEKQFREGGPSAVLLDDVNTNRIKLPSGSQLRDRYTAFANVVERGNDFQKRLNTILITRPIETTVPFEDLVHFATGCREAGSNAIASAAVDAAYTADYAAFVAREVKTQLLPYSPKAKVQFAAACDEWRKARDALKAGTGERAAFTTAQRRIDDSRANLKSVFEEEPAFVTELLPAAESEAAARDQVAIEKHAAEMGNAKRSITDAAAALAAVGSAAAWRDGSQADVTKKIGLAKEAIASATAGDASKVDAATAASLADLERRAQRWSDHARALDAAIASLSSHDLAGAASTLASVADPDLKDDSIRPVTQAVASLQEGFQALDRLETRDAAAAFGRAGETLKTVAPKETYASRCAERAAALERLVAAGMAPVPEGEIQLSGKIQPDEPSGRTKVAAFWIDECEFSVDEFRKFLAALPDRRAAVDALVPTLPWLERRGKDGAFDLIKSPPSCFASGNPPDADWPVEQVSYTQAVVCLALAGKELPTLPEWWLAAKGSLGQSPAHHRFPWDSGVNARLDDASIPGQLWGKNKKVPVAVGSGGEAFAFSGTPVHHLSGNVDEWLQLPQTPAGDPPQACAIGGNYTDFDADRFSGELRRYFDVTRPAQHVGFRGVVRPRDFFSTRSGGEELLPKSR